MENTTPPHTIYTRTMLLILAVVLLLASVVGYFVSGKLQSNQNSGSTEVHISPTVAPTLIPYPTDSLFKIE
ncbi:MAG: hypothetical protein NTZ55_01585 [Candidatus Roizmanbacteria bacterium]|nr:hypothetical protein [Candidatus Roizmanbacteria bacterium]